MPIDVSVCCFRKSKVLEKKIQLNLFSVLINKADYFKNLSINNTLYNFVYLHVVVHENTVSTYLSFNS